MVRYATILNGKIAQTLEIVYSSKESDYRYYWYYWCKFLNEGYIVFGKTEFSYENMIVPRSEKTSLHPEDEYYYQKVYKRMEFYKEVLPEFYDRIIRTINKYGSKFKIFLGESSAYKDT